MGFLAGHLIFLSLVLPTEEMGLYWYSVYFVSYKTSNTSNAFIFLFISIYWTSKCPVNVKAIRDTEMNAVNKSIKGKRASKGKLKFRERQHGICFHLVWHRLTATHTLKKNLFLLLMVYIAKLYFQASLANRCDSMTESEKMET